MSIKNQLLGDLISGIYYSQTFDEKFRIFSEHIQKLGYEGCAYTFVPNAILETNLNFPPIFAMSDTFSGSFVEQYVVDRFDERDFTLRAIKENKLYPMEWSKWLKSEYLTQSEKDVLNLAKNEHGIQHGISIPVMNEPLGMAGFSITNNITDTSFNLLNQESLETLHLSCKAFHDIVFSRPSSYHLFIPEALKTLTDKERIVLEFVCQGKSMAELDRSNAPISKRYGEKLLLNLRHKYGGITTNELVRYITQLDLV